MMYFSLKAKHLSGFVFTVFLLCDIIAFPFEDEDNTLQLKFGFDLAQGSNGAPSLRIRNFEEVPGSRKLNGENQTPKRADRAESSSESENDDDIKKDKEKGNPPSDLSDDAESSGSEGERRLSTRGLIPEDFEPEDNPKIHGKYKEEDSE